MDPILTGVLVGAAGVIAAAVKPIINAWSAAMVRKANRMYQDDKNNIAIPDSSPEERRKRVVKQLSRSMLGAPVPESVLKGLVQRGSEAPDGEPKP